LQIAAHHAGALEEASAGTRHWEAKARRALALSEETVRRTADLFEQQRVAARRERERAVREREAEVAAEADARANAERAKRVEALQTV
jgi:cytochrome c553